MNVTMPDGTVVKNVPEGMSPELVMYRYRQSTLNPEYQPDIGGPLQQTMIGAGKTLTDISRGVRNIAGSETAAAEQAEAERLYQPMSESPWATAGQMLPGFATMPLSGGLLTQMGIGAGMGGIRGTENQGGQAVMEGLLSGAGYGAGKAITSGIGKVMNATKGVKTPSGYVDDVATRADELGMMVPPGQKLGSLPLQQLEASAKSTPFVSGLFEEGMDQNQRIINRLSAEAIGETGENVTPNMLGRAATRIGSVYEDVAQGIDEIPVGFNQIRSMAIPDVDAYFNRYAKSYPELEYGVISGERFKSLRNRIAKDSRAAWKSGKADVGEGLDELQGALQTSIEDISPSAKDALREAGRQWKVLKALERGKTVTKGNVNPLSMDTSLRNLDKGGYLRGRTAGDDAPLGKLYDSIRVANQFTDVVGDSGTATRRWLADLASDPQAAVVGGTVIRPIMRQYLKSQSPGVYAGLLGAIPGTELGGQATAGGLRGLLGGQQ